ncbi:MAG TPA: outer membrane lipoprotein chaperone LolA [Casimicrobiaceae bacterium]|nr:outer membrane lipoprotein chaperone LolA [Casimicrobiaceae bacterium]
MNPTLRYLCAGALAWFATTAYASGLDQLHQFLEQTKTLRGSFVQTVTNAQRRTTQNSRGTFAFARPGRFRWTYEKPFDQLIVGDGSQVWVYDKDLNQVIVRKLDRALGSTPAALLAGDNALENNFSLTSAPAREGLEFVEATPKSAEAQFSKVRLGFKDGLPQTMELNDAFGNTTVLTFDNLERNPQLKPDVFAFTPPPGADVVGENGPGK